LKKLFVLIFIAAGLSGYSQTRNMKLISTFHAFHQALILVDTSFIKHVAINELTYGHSNGWVETKTDILKNLTTGYLKYFEIKEDSLNIKLKRKVAVVRFVGDYKVSLNGGEAIRYHLKVLELWMRNGKNWKLFARQAVK